MIKVYVWWSRYDEQAEVFTLKEFENLINTKFNKIDWINIQFFVE